MRSLQKSNAHVQEAVQRLPLGGASNFRHWGYDRTIHIDRRVLCDPDSRAPRSFCEAHDETCLSEALESFGDAVAAIFAKLGRGAGLRAAG